MADPEASARIFISYRREDSSGHVLALLPALLLHAQNVEALDLLDLARTTADEQRIETWLTQARQSLDRGDISGASDLIDQALALDPNLEPALARRGSASRDRDADSAAGGPTERERSRKGASGGHRSSLRGRLQRPERCRRLCVYPGEAVWQFSEFDSYTLRVDDPATELSPDGLSATVVCTATHTFKRKRAAAPVTERLRQTFSLRKRGAGWIIASIGYDRRS